MINLDTYIKFLNGGKAKLEILKEKGQKLDTMLATLGKSLSDLREADDVMNAVSVLAQEDSKNIVEELVTLAMQSVYGDNYSFEVDNKINRGQPETFFYVVKDGERCLLKSADDYFGGGVVDICSFALRVVMWAIQDSKSDNVLLLDEPMKNLDTARLTLAGKMIQELSKALNLQFIIITHEDELILTGDSTFLVTQTNGVSKVERTGSV